MTPQSLGSPLKDLRRYPGPSHALSGGVCPSQARFQSWAVIPLLSFIELPSYLVSPEVEVNVGQV